MVFIMLTRQRSAPPTILSAAMAVGLSTAAPAAIAPLAPWGALLGKQLLFLFIHMWGFAFPFE